jgi:ABC-type glycerol-3-phosphate transport system permease component
MPNVKPAWITLIIFAFTAAWQITGNSFIFNEALKPLPTVLQQIQVSGIARAGVGAAATVFLMCPPMILFIFCQSNVLETMAHSGLKE